MKAEEYLGRVVEYCHLKVTCLLRVVETGLALKMIIIKSQKIFSHLKGETWSGEEDFLLDKPRLSISLEGEAFRRRQAGFTSVIMEYRQNYHQVSPLYFP